MLPVASDDFSQQPQLLSDNPSPPLHQQAGAPEHETIGKAKKKGKGGHKGREKGTKTTAKPSSESLMQQSSPHSESPSTQYPCQGSHNIPSVTSPALDALGSLAGAHDSDVVYRTDTWARSIPYGKSPPADPPDGDLGSHPSSTSPPPRARPLRCVNDFAGSDRSRQQSADRQKSSSLNSLFSSQIPLPHLPQAHFYGVPSIDLQIHPGLNRPAADLAYSFCSFDYIASPLKMSKIGGNVLISGTDGALEAIAIEDHKTRLIGKLEGLSGRVIEAKILHVHLQYDAFASSRPHVAIIVHGPAQVDDEYHTSSTGSDTNEMPAALTGRLTSAEKRSERDAAKFYQTKAEIYSLRTGDHICTLFASKPVPRFETLPGLPQFAPSPVGSLKLCVSGNYIALASGVSGEVYIYGANSSPSGYQCLGKTWTSVQTRESRRYSISSSSTDPDGSRNNSPHTVIFPDSPILSLGGRWLAVVPPSSTARTSIQGTVPVALIQGKVFGLETRNPPPKPVVTCATDVGDGESFLDKMARGVTQELVRGARWMGDQGIQAWNSYWNKEQQQSPAVRRMAHLPDAPQQGYNIFPPTHAQDIAATSTAEPDIVSILDLRRLEDGGESKSAPLSPTTAFYAPNGCSFLSFCPNGLMLFTASRKGDVQYVWDLMQVKFCRAGAFLSDDEAPSTNVRRVARYVRLTASNIVDVIWARPSGDRLAIITRKGTVHVFDLPKSAFQWPPFRRPRTSPDKVPGSDTATDELGGRTSGGNPFSAAMKLVGDRTQPIFAAVRGRTQSTGPGFSPAGGFASVAGVRSGKVVAAGLSKSMGAASETVNTLRRAGENRLHGLSRDPEASRVIWTSYKGQPCLGLIDSGSFRMYKIGRVPSGSKGRPAQSVIGPKEIDMRLPASLQTPCGPMHVGSVSTEQNTRGYLALPTSSSQAATGSKPQWQPLSQAEIETNAPYQPFHTDHRVSLYAFTQEYDPSGSIISLSAEQWVFGDEQPMSKLHVRPFSGSRAEDQDAADEFEHEYCEEMENLISLSNSTGNGEEVVITTRRKKGRARASAASRMDDGFFEDDCEVLDFARDRV